MKKEDRIKRKKMYIGGKAGDTNFISQKKQLGTPGPIAGIGGETIKCLWCDKLFDGIMASCGTGTTWSLYRCPHCKSLTANGSIIPNVVKTDPAIKIMNGSNNVALGKTALSGSPEYDACYSFLGEKEAKKMSIFRRKKKLALVWMALNLTPPGGTIEVYDVMRFIERIVGKKKVMSEWRKYLRDDKKGIEWLKNKLTGCLNEKR